MIGELPEEVINKLDAGEHDFTAHGLITKAWARKGKYEEATIIMDFREVDHNGTLDITKKLDKTTNKFIPTVEMISGCLIITIKREK